MKCECGADTKTKDTRRIEQGIWRRRYCPECETIFTTIEQRCETVSVPYTSKVGARETKGQVVAPPVPKVPRPARANQRAVAKRKPSPANAAFAPVPAPQDKRAASVPVDRVAPSARDRIEDMKFDRENSGYGWDE